ncbi:MAG TPA: hypothetical protein PLK34_00060 [Candidatus Pacearchaeota archaeon]|nr:hypothetical protein [Candidatus Pacearchaeota archaeon]
MKKISLMLFGVFSCIFLINLILAAPYVIEFNQIQDSIVVKETFPDNQTKYYNEPEILDISGNNLYFLKRIIFTENYPEVKIRINLDEGIVIQSNQVFPEGYKFESDGKKISIVWNLKEVKSSQTFAIFVELKDTKQDISVYIAFFLGVLLAILVFYLILDKLILSKKRQIEKQKIAEKIGIAPVVKTESKQQQSGSEKYEYLLDAEKKVIEALKQAERNELWQKQIQNLTGFSKAKVSRLINNLEQRNLIRKINFGNTNKIRLK